MKLLFLTLSYPPSMEGGARIYLHNIVSNLSPSSVFVYTNSCDDCDTFDASQAFRIIRNDLMAKDFGKFGKARMWFSWLRELVPLLKRVKVDILQVSDLFYIGPVAWVLSRLFDIPYVLYIFAEELSKQAHHRHSVHGRLRECFCIRLIKDATGLVVVSDYTQSLVREFGADEAKIKKVIPMVSLPVVVTNGKLEVMRHKYRLTSVQRVILCVGRLVSRKGQDYLIRAMPQVLSTVPDALLVIVGRGPDEKRLQDLVNDVGIQESVIFTGFVDDDELSAWYELCEVFAMPHRETETGDTEGCPTVFLEANAYGKPVVGGKAGGVHDAIWDGETGFIVDGEQPEQIAESLIMLLEDKYLAQALGNQGRQRVLTELSPKQGAVRVWEFNRTILEFKSL